ncbi:hypothetical protein C3L33_15250, partial [Rhododendron williamsianum]
MGSFSTETRSSTHYLQLQDYPDLETHEFTLETMEEEDDANPPTGFSRNPKKTKSNKSKNVFLEGYVEAAEDDDLTRTKSLTDEDLEELKGCLDLGFGFSYEEIPELCNTLPALELCYSMNQRFLDEQQRSPESRRSTMLVGFFRPDCQLEDLESCLSQPVEFPIASAIYFPPFAEFLVIILKTSKRGSNIGHKLWHALSDYAARRNLQLRRMNMHFLQLWSFKTCAPLDSTSVRGNKSSLSNHEMDIPESFDDGSSFELEM